MSHRLQGSPVKLRRRLVGAVTLVTVLTLGVAFVVVSYAVNADQQRQLDNALLSEAREEASEVAQLGGERLAIRDGPGPLANDIGPLTKYGALYGRDGTLLAATETFHGRAPDIEAVHHPLGDCFDTWFKLEHLRAVMVAVPAHPGTTLLLAAPRFDLDSDASFLRRAMLCVFFVAVLWAALVANWVVRRLTRGHEAIASVARQVAEGDLSARIPAAVSGSEMAQLAHDVNQMIERLSALLSSQQEFIAHAAHELRSPLTTLYGELSHALRRSRDADSYQRSIAEALDSTRKLKLLAEELLTLARLDAAPPEPTELMMPKEIIAQAIHMVSSLAAEREVVVQVKGPAHPISGRSQDIERLFRNLLENAIRYSPRGSSIEVALSEEPGWLVVTVSDQGPGVPEADRSHIFKPFYRASRARADAEGGVGLGLTIARRIALSHGGDLTLASQQERGAQFVVLLPAN